MVYAGALIVRGRSQGVVVATGSYSLVGSLALDVLNATETGGKPPLVERMEIFTKRIAMAVLIAAALIGIAGVTFAGFSMQEMFLFAVALAVSAVPEGLPVALTVALASAFGRIRPLTWSYTQRLEITQSRRATLRSVSRRCGAILRMNKQEET